MNFINNLSKSFKEEQSEHTNMEKANPELAKDIFVFPNDHLYREYGTFNEEPCTRE